MEALDQPTNPIGTGDRRTRMLLIVNLLAFFVALAPTLPMMQFFRTPENLVIATALEMRRDGHWLLPTLEGELRTVKPPLAAWITAAFIRPSTVAAMSSTDPALRDAADRTLATEARLPWLVAACVMLAAAFELGQTIGGPRFGLPTALVTGSTFLLLRNAPAATTDIGLAMWVTITNVFLAKAVLHSKRWFGCVGAGIALGLALMTKGPPALVQTVLPFAVYCSYTAVRRRSIEGWTRWIAPVLVGTVLMLAIAVPWPLAIYLRDPSGQWITWQREITGQDAPERRDPLFAYAGRLLPMFFPWSLFLVIGLWYGVKSFSHKVEGAVPSPLSLAMILLVMPLVVMSFFKDRKDRYMLPMTAPAAVLVVSAVRRNSEGPLAAVHWAMLGVCAIGLPIAGASGISQSARGIDGTPWYSWPLAAAASLASGVLLYSAIRSTRRNAMSLVPGTFVVMLLVQLVFNIGYRRTASGSSEMKPMADLIWQKCPTAEMFNGQPVNQRAAVDLSIYLNRVTRWVPPTTIATMSPGERPKVMVLLQHENDPLPTLNGWERLTAVAYGNQHWWAMVMR